MKRMVGLLLAAALLGAGTASASEIGLGLGAFGGSCASVSQDDVGDGFVYGARLPVNLIHLLTVEGFYEASSLGDGTDSSGVSTPGFDLSAWGANVLIGTLGGGGINFYPYIGIGSYTLDHGDSSETDTGYSFGFGMGLPPISKFSIQLRIEGDAVDASDKTRWFGLLAAGLNYRFGK